MFFASAWTDKTGLQDSQALVTTEKVWSKEDVPLVEEDQVKQYLSKLYICKSTDCDGRYPGVLRELTDVIARPLDNL